jgi:hypothetical protein
MTRRHPFATRLALARRLIARGASPAPVHLADQLAAAGHEARRQHDCLGAALPLIQPGRNWRQRIDPDPSDDVRAYILAAVLDCTRVCVQTTRRPPPDEADRCDVCTTRGVTTFHPFAVRMGPALVVGDACASCAGVLGIVQEAAS